MSALQFRGRLYCAYSSKNAAFGCGTETSLDVLLQLSSVFLRRSGLVVA